MGELSNRRVQRSGLLGRFEEGLDLATLLGVPGVRFEEGVALGRIQLDRAVEELLDAVPALGVEPFFAQAPSSL